MRLKSKLSIALNHISFSLLKCSFIFRKRFSPKFLWSLGLHKGSSNWFQIIYGRVNHLMTSINNATFQLWRRKIQSLEIFNLRKKTSNTIKTLHERHFSSWKTPFNVNSDDQIATHVWYYVENYFWRFSHCLKITQKVAFEFFF